MSSGSDLADASVWLSTSVPTQVVIGLPVCGVFDLINKIGPADVYQCGRSTDMAAHETALRQRDRHVAVFLRKAVFTTLSLISAEIEFAQLDARVLTHTVRPFRIPHCRDWQAVGSYARGLARSYRVAATNAKWNEWPAAGHCRPDPPV